MKGPLCSASTPNRPTGEASSLQSQYRDLPTIYHVEHLHVLVLVRDGLVRMKSQADYLRQKLSEQDQWQQRKEHGA